MNPESIKSCLDVLDKHTPRDPVINKIGLTPDQVRRATRAYVPEGPAEPRFAHAVRRMYPDTVRRHLKFLRKYRDHVRRGLKVGFKATKEFCARNGFSGDTCCRMLYATIGNVEPTHAQLSALIECMEGRLK